MDLGSDQRSLGRVFCCLPARLEATPMPTLHSKAGTASSQLWNHSPGDSQEPGTRGSGSSSEETWPMETTLSPGREKGTPCVSSTQDGTLLYASCCKLSRKANRKSRSSETWKCSQQSQSARESRGENAK